MYNQLGWLTSTNLTTKHDTCNFEPRMVQRNDYLPDMRVNVDCDFETGSARVENYLEKNQNDFHKFNPSTFIGHQFGQRGIFYTCFKLEFVYIEDQLALVCYRLLGGAFLLANFFNGLKEGCSWDEKTDEDDVVMNWLDDGGDDELSQFYFNQYFSISIFYSKTENDSQPKSAQEQHCTYERLNHDYRTSTSERTSQHQPNRSFCTYERLNHEYPKCQANNLAFCTYERLNHEYTKFQSKCSQFSTYERLNHDWILVPSPSKPQQKLNHDWILVPSPRKPQQKCDIPFGQTTRHIKHKKLSRRNSVRDCVRKLALHDSNFKPFLKTLLLQVENNMQKEPYILDSIDYENKFMALLYTKETPFFVLLINVYVKIRVVNIFKILWFT
eukprot:UN33208